MINNKIFAISYDRYTNKLDRLFVWMCDNMEMSKWYDASYYWDLVMLIYDAGCYNSGIYISIDIDNKRWKKIHEETIKKHEKVNSISDSPDFWMR